MNRADLIKSLKNYQSNFNEELSFKKEFLELLKDSDCFLRSRLEGHITASCWVTDKNQNVLLLHHRKLNKWLQPGGHADGDEHLFQVAEKELNEETGLINTSSFSRDIFDIDIHQIPKKNEIPEHLHYDVRYQFVAENPDEINKNHESIDLKWIHLKDVTNLCNHEKSIVRMIEKTKALPRVLK